MAQEPILWADKAKPLRSVPARRFNPTTGQMEDAFDEDTGRRLYERIPQRAHVGGDYDSPVASKTPRWIHVLRHDGFEVRVPITGAAADLDTTQSTAQERRAKAFHLGWIDVGSCPLQAVQAGTIQAGQLLAKEIRGQAPCAPGTHGPTKHCPHYLAEKKARQDMRGRDDAKDAKKHRSEADKLIAAQSEQTRDIVTGVAGALADAIRGKGGK